MNSCCEGSPMAARPFPAFCNADRAGIRCLALVAICGGVMLAAFLRLTSIARAEEKQAAAGKQAEKEKKETDGDAPDRKAQMAAMRRIGAGLKVTVSSDE